MKSLSEIKLYFDDTDTTVVIEDDRGNTGHIFITVGKEVPFSSGEIELKYNWDDVDLRPGPLANKLITPTKFNHNTGKKEKVLPTYAWRAISSSIRLVESLS